MQVNITLPDAPKPPSGYHWGAVITNAIAKPRDMVASVSYGWSPVLWESNSLWDFVLPLVKDDDIKERLWGEFDYKALTRPDDVDIIDHFSRLIKTESISE